MGYCGAITLETTVGHFGESRSPEVTMRPVGHGNINELGAWIPAFAGMTGRRLL